MGGHRTGTLLPHASPSSVYNNKYSYATDLSLSSNSHYGYTSWGLWRGAGGPGTDSRNISPSIYSHHNGSKKRRRNIKSFSILLMSAAMIVVLAVLAVAGLAFYFSTFKSDQTDCKYTFVELWCFLKSLQFFFWISKLNYDESWIRSIFNCKKRDVKTYLIRWKHQIIFLSYNRCRPFKLN